MMDNTLLFRLGLLFFTMVGSVRCAGTGFYAGVSTPGEYYNEPYGYYEPLGPLEEPYEDFDYFLWGVPFGGEGEEEEEEHEHGER